MSILLAPPSFEDILIVLRAWRLWLVGAVIGSLIGSVIYLAFPPVYRAKATVVVDFNVEKTWPVDTDRELFYHLERESRKVEAVAWSDAVLKLVADGLGEEPGDVTIPDLYDGRLTLSQPSDGAWHFYADSASSRDASKTASLWAQAFVTVVNENKRNILLLENIKKRLDATPESEPLQKRAHSLETRLLGISTSIEVVPTQVTGLSVERKVGLGVYVLAGSLSGIFLMVLGALFIRRKESARS